MVRSIRVLGVAASLLSSTALGGTLVSESKSNPFPGVTLVKRVESGPPNRIYAAYITLCANGVKMAATKPPSSLRTPGAWGASEGVELATNGDFFVGTSVYGDAVGGGVHWPLSKTGVDDSSGWYYRDYGWIAFGPDWVEFSHTKQTKTADAAKFGVQHGFSPTAVSTKIPAGTVSLVSGFPELVIEGQTYTCSSPTASSCFPDRTDMRARHPRTAMGLSADRGTFILVAVDGRKSGVSEGMYGSELASLMAKLGAWQAFNLDGGGSTAMWLSGTGYVNSPSDGSARSVANHWGVHASGSGAPANCFTPGGCYAAPVPGAEAREYQDMPQGTVGYAEAVALRDAKVVTGCKTTPPLFCPKCSLTRAEAVRFILRAGKVDVSNPPTTASFSDVATDSADYAYVETAKALGMTNGCGSGKFCPGDPLTRAAFARMLRVGADFLESDPATPTYSDVPRDHANYGDIETLVRRCAAEPCASGQFCPTATVERGEAAAMIARAFEIKAKSGCSPDPLEEELIASDDPGQMTDIDADGRTDVCMRTATGYDCHLSSGGVFATPLAGPAFSDSSGWADPSNYSTLRMNDFDGDGRADICARANKGIVCWYSDADGFSAGVDGPEWSDALGFNKNQYFTTLRSGDVNGDGRADLCIRTSTDFRCHLSTGRSFGDARIGPDFSDAAGFDHAARYGSIRLGDINGDKRDDVCALDGTALKCFVATDDGFGPSLTGPAWSDDDGFDQGARVLTLQLVDVDGDERADACIRTDTDFRCHLSTGTAFDDAHIGPALSDASGWSKYRYATTLRLADIDGDGDRDLCARAAAGMRCYPWESGTFGSAIVGPELSDAKGWGRERYFRTLRLSDVDGDGRADLCARAAKGLMCWPGTETGFSANPEDGPEWSDALGLWRVRYFSTLALSAPKRSGVPGPGGWGGGGNITPGGAGAGNASEDASEGGCGCRLSRSADDYGLLVALGFSLLLAARRRPTRRRRRFGS